MKGFLGWEGKVQALGHVLAVTRGSEVPLLSYCKVCERYAERTGQGLSTECYGKPGNKNAKRKLKRMLDGKHPKDNVRLGEELGTSFWEAISAGAEVGGTVFRPKVGELSWDADVQGGASDSIGNVLLCEPCGAGASGIGSVWGDGGEPCGVGDTSGPGGGLVGPCGADASGPVGGEPWEAGGASGSGDVLSGDEEVAALWWEGM